MPTPLSPSFCLKDLAPQDARMALGAVRFAEEELERAGHAGLRGRTLLVAFSGGADSTALLLLFCALREPMDIALHAAHFDHGLRKESRAEAEAAESLCRELGVPFHTRREDVAALAEKWHCGIEEAGRRARYRFLEQTRRTCGAEWVLTAHHSGDLAEDVLMRLTRGAGWPGLGGMRAVVEEAGRGEKGGRTDGIADSSEPARRILRPLLMLDKAELVALLERLGVPWQEDATNQSREWKRSRLRVDVMPLLLAENPSFGESIRRLWRSAREDERWWSALTEEALETCGEGEGREIRLSAVSLEKLGRAGRLRAMAEAVRRMERGQCRADTLEDMETVWMSRRFPRRFSFAGGLKAEISAQGVRFFLAPGR
ncbi:MAG: tRNA lysidine(34) synthetase TilS [Mailhella sp.]|nr:tRNA lysidine(34) synthetase TilS [Mailhella sp.]